MAKAKKNFVLVDSSNKDTNHVFKSAQPRGAALKAVNKLAKDMGKQEVSGLPIRLRERGTKPARIHCFTGERKRVKAPDNRPAWLPEMIWKANVKKSGVERL